MGMNSNNAFSDIIVVDDDGNEIDRVIQEGEDIIVHILDEITITPSGTSSSSSVSAAITAPLIFYPSIGSGAAGGAASLPSLPLALTIASITYGLSETIQGRNPVTINGGYMGLTNPGLYAGPAPNAWAITTMKRLDTQEAQKAARDWGYNDIHDLKGAHEVGSDYNIYRDGKTGKGTLRPNEHNKHKPDIEIVPDN